MEIVFTIPVFGETEWWITGVIYCACSYLLMVPVVRSFTAPPKPMEKEAAFLLWITSPASFIAVLVVFLLVLCVMAIVLPIGFLGKRFMIFFNRVVLGEKE